MEWTREPFLHGGQPRAELAPVVPKVPRRSEAALFLLLWLPRKPESPHLQGKKIFLTKND